MTKQNFFDQFDDVPPQASEGGNFFDQFDEPTKRDVVEKPLEAPESTWQQKALGALDTYNAAVGPKAWAQRLSGATMGFSDEALSKLQALPALFNGQNYDEAADSALQDIRADLKKTQDEHEYLSKINQLGGSLALGGGTGAALKAGAPKVAGALQAYGKANPWKTTAGLSGAYGAVDATGRSDKPIGESGTEALVGGIGSALFAPLLLAGGKGVSGYLARKLVDPKSNVSKLSSFFQKKPITGEPTSPPIELSSSPRSLQKIASDQEGAALVKPTSLNADNKAVDKVITAIKKDFPDDWEEVLRSWQSGNEPLAKAYGSRVTTLAKGAAQFPSGKAQADSYFNKEVANAPERLKSAVNKNINGIQNYYATVDDVLAVGKAKASPLYEKAFSSAKGISDERINQFLAQPELQTGINKGLKIQRLEATAEGKPFNPADYAITAFNEAGDPIINKVPNMRLLDAGKRGLDAMIQEQTDPVTGKVTELGRALIKTKQSYVSELKRVNPHYEEALNSAGDYFSIDNAIKSGKDFMRLDSEILRKNLSEMSGQERVAFKVGVGKQIRDLIDNSYEGYNPYNKVFGSNEQKKRLATILNPSEYRNLEQSLKSENRLFKMRNEVLGGSPTTSKAMAAAELAAGGADAALALTTGNIKTVGTSALKGMVQKAFSGLNDKTANAVSKLIYETDPTSKLLLLEKTMGDKSLTDTERQIIKKTYFKASDLIKARDAAAISTSLTQQPEE